jgi:hypothetical protein
MGGVREPFAHAEDFGLCLLAFDDLAAQGVIGYGELAGSLLHTLLELARLLLEQCLPLLIVVDALAQLSRGNAHARQHLCVLAGQRPRRRIVRNVTLVHGSVRRRRADRACQ